MFKHFLLLISLSQITGSLLASEESGDLPPASPPSDQRIADDAEGAWSTGYLVGTVQSKEWQNGVIWNNGLIEFLAGGGLGDRSLAYPPQAYSVYVKPKKQILWNSFRPSPKTVVLKYYHPFITNPLATRSRYFLVRMMPAYKRFSDSPSGKKFPGGIETEPVHDNGWFYRHKQAAGVIIHVSRWGNDLIEPRCTVYLHKGGYGKVSIDEFVATDEWVYDPITKTYKKKKVTYTSTTGKSEPNVTQLDTYNEDICKYSEDAARAQADVYVEYSGFEPDAGIDTGVLINAEIHNILVQPETSQIPN